MDILTGSFEEKLRNSITFAWKVFMERIGAGVLEINKEASMQLHYSNILQQVLPLICFEEDENVKIELETRAENILGKNREIDLVLVGKKFIKSQSPFLHKIAVEMKCYKTMASSNKARGATDIFMKDVYEDMAILEEYCSQQEYDKGVALVMSDMSRLVYPKKKDAKCWDYDISNGVTVGHKIYTTPIGGKNINITLNKTYTFKWEQKGEFFFMENEGY